jgi:hypothetical protein
MPLFTDSDIITAADLAQIDSEVTLVADATKPGLVLEGPGSCCEQAWRECSQKLNSAMQLYSTYLAQPGVTGGHLAAVLNVGVPSRTQPRVRLNQIVAHEWNYAAARSPLQTWMLYVALHLLYRDASSRLGKDRYQEKMERYRADAMNHWRDLLAVGLPTVYQPMEAPGGKHSYRAGTWGVANLSASAGGAAIATNVTVAITWYDSSKYVSQTNNGNAESAPSAILSYTIPAANYLTVDITSLNPPTGAADQVGTAQGTWVPLTATHWNIWAGAAQSDPNAPPVLYLQREGIAIATKTATLTAAPTFSGSVLGQGQWPDLNTVFQNVVMRG